MQTNPTGGRAFDDEDVAAAYTHRPPYPDALIEFVGALPARQRRALDLGCGPGKLTHQLAGMFEQVDAVDPALPMLRIANDGRHPHIRWLHAAAETADLPGPYDLVTAGASIHWMDHAVVFPRLAASLAAQGYIAIVEGDGPHNPPWQAAWETFLTRWIARLGGSYDPDAFSAHMTAYRAWLEIAGERTFSGIFSQSVEHFVECQHSRATWSRANLGSELTAAFDTELGALLAPYADDGQLTYETRAEVVWGRPALSRA